MTVQNMANFGFFCNTMPGKNQVCTCVESGKQAPYLCSIVTHVHLGGMQSKRLGMVLLPLERTRPNHGGMWRIVANCSLFRKLIDKKKGSKGAAKPPNMLQKVAKTYCAPYGEDTVY